MNTSKEKGSRRRMGTPVKVTIVTAAVLIVAVLAAIIYAAATRPAPISPNDSTGEEVCALGHPGKLPCARQRRRGDAPTLVEFLDFECEACGAFYPVVEQIREAYDGKINYVIRYFPIPNHFNSMNAAIAVEAASQQGRVEEMYNKLFQTQTEGRAASLRRRPVLWLRRGARTRHVAVRRCRRRSSDSGPSRVRLQRGSRPWRQLHADVLPRRREARAHPAVGPDRCS